MLLEISDSSTPDSKTLISALDLIAAGRARLLPAIAALEVGEELEVDGLRIRRIA